MAFTCNYVREVWKLNLIHDRTEILLVGSVPMTMHFYDKNNLILQSRLAPDEELLNGLQLRQEILYRYAMTLCEGAYSEMSITSEVTLARDGSQENLRIPPHVVELVRWCVSYIWRAASVILQRLMVAPLPHVPALTRSASVDSQNGTRPKTRSKSLARQPPSSEHICAEPKVDCMVLHEPDCEHTIDIIFVHGLYGSLANTWRQGDWRPKYKIQPKIEPLRKRSKSMQCNCECEGGLRNVDTNDKINIHETSEVIDNFDTNNYKQHVNNNIGDTKDDGFFDEIATKDEIFKRDFTKTLLNQVKIYDYDYEKNDGVFKVELDENVENDFEICCECRNADEKRCPIGCGCVCNKCYSLCWPKDWLKMDHPTCRVISINYTSDPYLWRPRWIKESKRLELPERAGQMMKQLLELGVGKRPVIWVAHSKGGLFVKEIYSEAYEAHLRLAENPPSDIENINLALKASLWHRSVGFMFYSVPHRGSPLADINIPPLVARSIELLEISKDCSTVLGLHERWLRATERSQPAVRSLVETCRTLMAVLWLRIVSEESADAGIGALCGVSLDHREICKPSSRSCLLYTELLHLINTAVNKCTCDNK